MRIRQAHGAMDCLCKIYSRVHVKDGQINSVYPNPVSGSLNISYQLEHVSSAQILITQPLTNQVSVYTINPAATSTTINMQGYIPGIYSVILVGDGQQLDATTIHKQ